MFTILFGNWRMNLHTIFISCSFVIALSACSTMPSSGPTRNAVESSLGENSIDDIKIVDISKDVVDHINLQIASASTFLPEITNGDGRHNVLAIGDILRISIYEVGASLFSDSSLSLGGRLDYGAKAVVFDNVVVDEDGNIYIPYVGVLNIAGKKVQVLRGILEKKLSALSQKPQVSISVIDSANNKIFVSGGVGKPGVYPLGFTSLKVLDSITLAGGVVGPSYDFLVRLTRAGVEKTVRLSEIRPSDSSNVSLSPGDRIELIRQPRSFIALGAAAKASHVGFEGGNITLAEAIGKFSGLNDQLADPEAVYLFRNYTGSGGQGEKKVIYKLNLLDSDSIFFSKEIMVKDRDLIYVANARSNAIAKVVGIVNQLFAPFVTVKALSR